MKEIESLEQLVMLARNGDEAAKINILEKFKPLLLKNIMKYYGKNQDFHDWLQEGRLVILQAIKNYNENLGVPFAAYVQRQVFYYYINERKKIREEVILDKPLCDGNLSLLEILPNDDIQTEETLVDNEEKRLLYNSINKLSIKQKEVIKEYYFNRKSLKSMAGNKCLCYQSLIKLKARALKKLREGMEGS